MALSTFTVPAQAADINCSAEMDELNFGPIDPISGSDVTSTATIHWKCTARGFLSSAKIRMCLSIGTGTNGGSQIHPRQVKGDGSSLEYQLYRDATHSQVLGSANGRGNPIEMKILIGGITPRGKTKEGDITVYGLLPAGQTGVTPGEYTSAFAGANAMVSFRDNWASASGALGRYPKSCGRTDNGGSFPFNVRAQVEKKCTVSASDMDFGSLNGLLETDRNTTSFLSLQCTHGTDYDIGLDEGQHYAGGTRRMADGNGNYVDYQLYQQASHATVWDKDNNTKAGSGNGQPENITVHGQVPAQTTPPAGQYQDIIQINVTY